MGGYNLKLTLKIAPRTVRCAHTTTRGKQLLAQLASSTMDSDLMEHALSATDGSMVCSTCSSGYQYNTGTCGSCSLNCLTCVAAGAVTVCTACQTGSVMNMTSQLCIPCPDKCSSCSISGATTVCNPFGCPKGYAVAADGTCQACSKLTFTNCVQCSDVSGSGTGKSTCQDCAAGYGLQEGNSGCQSCSSLTKCGKCIDLATGCTKCASGLTPDVDGSSCGSMYTLTSLFHTLCAHPLYFETVNTCLYIKNVAFMFVRLSCCYYLLTVTCYACNSTSQCDPSTSKSQFCPTSKGSSCWVTKLYNLKTGTNQIATGCYQQTCDDSYTSENCENNTEIKMCKKCCTTDKCNSFSLKGRSTASSVKQVELLAFAATTVVSFLFIIIIRLTSAL
ncbi:hypothetical protein HELRODRAFT_187818 [Helobdella robusta]|uniref:TNFR-Cys domain-containing protein n=1 Tax=Helobdella robusta TaxID=6412 RepID=T1FPE5_HELRO|nr:hypothetical protein HELRODRAFT_187818 [Helobdella robusta]ESO12268.1 hypothetical protein HELRODRAFT_187818 [Helobdella robusta]